MTTFQEMVESLSEVGKLSIRRATFSKKPEWVVRWEPEELEEDPEGHTLLIEKDADLELAIHALWDGAGCPGKL